MRADQIVRADRVRFSGAPSSTGSDAEYASVTDVLDGLTIGLASVVMRPVRDVYPSRREGSLVSARPTGPGTLR
jgi:hypothetical protein